MCVSLYAFQIARSQKNTIYTLITISLSIYWISSYHSFSVIIFQIDTIVGEYGLVVISRSGSNPEKFIYESDQLSRLQVKNFHPGFLLYIPHHSTGSH